MHALASSTFENRTRDADRPLSGERSESSLRDEAVRASSSSVPPSSSLVRSSSSSAGDDPCVATLKCSPEGELVSTLKDRALSEAELASILSDQALSGAECREASRVIAGRAAMESS